MKPITTNILKISIIFCLLFGMVITTSAKETNAEAPFNPSELITEHLADSYEWHITTIGERHISIPLLIIVRSSVSGWHVFSSAVFHHQDEYKNFHIESEGKYAGKIVEKTPEGIVKPFDISITKNVFALLINCTLLVFVILYVARYYRKKSLKTPSGFRGFMELFIMNIYDDVIKKCIGEDAPKYAPYLLTAFFFIFFNNLMGLIPVFPGGANLTGNIAITFTLAICTFLAVNIFGTKEYWKEILWPEVPVWMKAPIPLMPVIELFGIFTKPFALMIRLFANIMAGHSVILGLTCIIFVTASMAPVVFGSMTFVSLFFLVFMNCVEILVAYIQAYVFTMLSSIFIGLSRVKHEHS